MAERVALITGAAGFIGRHVARALSRRGFRVHGVGLGPLDPAEARDSCMASYRDAEVEPGSLEAGPRPDVLIHAAGSGSVSFSASAPYRCFQSTVLTTAAVLEYARTVAEGAAVVLCSSAAVYGDAGAEAIPETAARRPVSTYGAHKVLAEDLCAQYGRLHGVRSARVRLFSVYGPGLRKQILWDACQRFSRAEHRFFGTGRETRDFLHVRDAATLLAVAAERATAESPIVNGGTGVGARISEVLGELGRALGSAETPTFNAEDRPGDPQHLVARTDVARSWGWAPENGWRDGVREYAAWFARRDA